MLQPHRCGAHDLQAMERARCLRTSRRTCLSILGIPYHQRKRCTLLPSRVQVLPRTGSLQKLIYHRYSKDRIPLSLYKIKTSCPQEQLVFFLTRDRLLHLCTKHIVNILTTDNQYLTILNHFHWSSTYGYILYSSSTQ